MFILVKENKTWEEAFIHCRRNYRDLAWSIDHRYLKTMAQVRAEMADTESVWVGLFYVCALESWVWVNGNYVDDENKDNWKYPGENECSVAGAIEKKRGRDKSPEMYFHIQIEKRDTIDQKNMRQTYEQKAADSAKTETDTVIRERETERERKERDRKEKQEREERERGKTERERRKREKGERGEGERQGRGERGRGKTENGETEKEERREKGETEREKEERERDRGERVEKQRERGERKEKQRKRRGMTERGETEREKEERGAGERQRRGETEKEERREKGETEEEERQREEKQRERRKRERRERKEREVKMQPLLFLLVFGQMCLSVSQNLMYHFINESKSWAEAQTFCRKYHTDLATVKHMRDLERLRAAADGQTDVWTGLYQTSDDLADRKWLWSQPEVKYKLENKWNANKPTDDPAVNCAVINNDGYWTDSDCQNTFRFLCYDETSKTTVLVDESKTWLEAQQYCRTNHTDLVSGRNQQFEEKYSSCSPECWIGLSRDTWGWSDQSGSSFRNWNTDVNPNDQKECAALVDQDRWERKDCSDSKPFICHEGSLSLMYHFINESKSWAEAQAFCRKYYTDLATVNHMRDLERLSTAADGQTDVWIGLHQTSDELADRKWHWSQPEVKYSGEWTPGEPTDKGAAGATRENCAVINAGGSWFDTNCERERSCFVCYNESSNTVVLIEEQSLWFEAQQYCRGNHTDLMSGPDQQRLLEAKYPNRPDMKCWIGLSRDTWGWSDGSDSTLRNWKTDVDPNPNKCAALVDQGQWEDDDYLVILVKEKKTWMEAYDYCKQNYCNLAWFLNYETLKKLAQEKAELADTEFVWVGLFYSCAMKTWMWVNGRYVSNDNDNWKHPGSENVCSVAGAMERAGEHMWVKINDKEKHNFICLR
ncbi:hypothetical protein WMY93_015084 [Mugilogobius chulae]|uniref:C-type lectin domain-containing protein n=1 Tax=Mugilogobius chulae TaxID=88201 RepID=A0AAW0P8H5_9GOBI